MANALLITITSLLTIGVSVIVMQPRMLSARDGEVGATDVQAREVVHQAVMTQLAGLFTECRGVLFHHGPDESPYLEALLWLEDTEYPEQLDAHELGLISYSPTLQAISLYTWEHAVRETAAGPELVRPPAIGSPDSVASLGFCDHWRTNHHMTRRTIATHIASAWWGPAEGYRPSEGVWGITLTWASDSADQNDAASVTVRRGRIGARQSGFEE